MRYGKIGEFFKIDESTGYAYGWAIICTKADQPYVDLQGDHIPEDAMISAAADFMSRHRVGKDMHDDGGIADGSQTGDITFAFPVTKANRDALGLSSVDMTGLMIAYRPNDPELLEKIKNGERTGFSIGGWLDDASLVDDASQIGKSALSTADKDDLPDSAFLYVEGGGKQVDGKTEPRSLRHFPYRDAAGKIDIAHLRAATQEIPKSSLPATIKEKYQQKAEKLLAAQHSKRAPLGKCEKCAQAMPYDQTKCGASGCGGGMAYKALGAWRKSFAKLADASGAIVGKVVRVFRTFKIREISTVDMPAQEPAKIALVKRASIERPVASALVVAVRKDSVFTSEVDGHQHVIDLDDVDDDGVGTTTYASIDTEDFGHAHSWMRDASTGKITLTANEGHTHEVSDADVAAALAMVPTNQPTTVTTIAARAPDTFRPPTIEVAKQLAIGMLPTEKVAPIVEGTSKEHAEMDKDAEIASLRKQLAHALSLASMTDAHRAHAARMSDHDRDAFVAKSAIDRDAIVAAAVAADTTYVSKKLGRTLRKSVDGETAIDLAKALDSQEEELAKAREATADAVYKAIAKDTMSSLAGDDATQVYVVKAIKKGGGDDKMIDAAIAMLKGANAVAQRAGQFRGVDPLQKGGPTDPQAVLKGKVVEFQKLHKIPSYEQALGKALQTDPEIQELFESTNEVAIA